MVENTIESRPLAEDFTKQIVTEAIKQGERYLADGNWKSAREQFQRAADVQADYAPAYRGLGMVAREMIEEQLSLPDGMVNSTLIEEACTELARAYRLGARDADTVRALAHLYHQFQRCEEYVDLLWNFAMTTDDFDAGFDAGCRSIAEMQEPCVNNHRSRERGFRFAERAVNAHETLLQRFDHQTTLTDQLDSYFHVFDAYRKVGRAADWLEQTERLVEQIGDEMTLMHRALYTRERGKMLREWGRHREAAHTFEAFIDWLQNTETVDPEKQALLIGVQGDYLHLAPTYCQLGEHQKVKALLAEAEANLESYFVERDAALAGITDESETTHKRLDRIYRNAGDYPAGGSVADIRRWLNRKYFIAIHIATMCLALGCAEVGEGEAAIRLLNRAAEHWDQRRNYIEEEVRVWSSGGRIMAYLAALTLKFRNDREASLEYLKRAHEDRRRAARGSIKRFFEEHDAFASVRHDPEFLAVANAPVVSQ